MRRFLRVRILFVLIALLLAPTVVLPFAERLRTEWARYWEPRVEADDEPQFASSETLRLLADLEQANYAQRASLGRADWCGTVSYASPVVQPGCLFRDEPDRRGDAIESADMLSKEAAARQERFLRSVAEVEKLGLPEFDEFDRAPLLSLPTEEYWAELQAHEARRKAAKP